MGIHVNIGKAKARLSELVAAAVRGEEVVLQRAGQPQARIVAIPEASDAEWEKIKARRRAAYGMFKQELASWDGVIPDAVPEPDPKIGY